MNGLLVGRGASSSQQGALGRGLWVEGQGCRRQVGRRLCSPLERGMWVGEQCRARAGAVLATGRGF